LFYRLFVAMRSLKYCCLALLATTLALACESEKEPSQAKVEADTLNQIEQDPMVQCLEVADQICGAGVWFAILGEQINNLPLDDLEALEVADSALSESGYVYIKRTIYLDGGEVVVEGTFLEEEKATEEELNVSKVHRIFFRNPSFRTLSDLKVGETVRAVMDKYQGQQLEVSVIPDYETVVVQLPDEGNMFLHFSDPANEWSSSAGENLSIESLPASWQIREIVVM
ncbi:MAG: hypothetical protein AAFN10_29025, partial [Bacteroidota bacterium]